jgi:RNA polymerase-interacting CarD/CdnL/TRCF family regulator
MNFNVGDRVVHWIYGLGEIVALEERVLTGQKMAYYVVKIQDMTVYVPADDKAKGRLRSPTSERGFKKLFEILSGPGESLSENRHERKSLLHTKLEDGKAETVCQVIRDLYSYEQKKQLNDDDKSILNRARRSLLTEWEFALSVPPAQAELELHRLLKHPA